MVAWPPGAWKLQLFNLTSSKLTLGLRAASCLLCAGWQGAVKPDWLIYTIWKGSSGALSRLCQQPFALIPCPHGSRGLLWSLCTSRTLMSWSAPLMLWTPALSSQPLGAARDRLAFSVHLEGPLLVFRAGRALDGESAGPGAGQEWRKPFCPELPGGGMGADSCMRIRPPLS